MHRVEFRALPFLLTAFTAGVLLAQNPDLTGTWTGEATLSGSTDKDRVTLILQKSGESYNGTISTLSGLAKEAPLESVKYDASNLRFQFTANRNGREVKIKVALNLIVGRLIGAWWADDISFSPLDLAPKK